MIAKQKAIKEAYSEDYERILSSDYGIDKEGFSDFYAHYNETNLHGYEIYSGHSPKDTIRVRPLGLGAKLDMLKNNNGWIKIESEADLPKEEIDCHFVYKVNDNRYQTFGVWDKKLNSFWSGALKIENVTHYQPIIKPQPPIY